MKRVLLIKLTSLGDLIHALPALSDAHEAFPEIEFDWLIDENFQEVALWHKAIRNIFTTNHRKWRTELKKLSTYRTFYSLVKRLRRTRYDLIIDGQGNFKSASLTFLMRGTRAGFNKQSVREKFAHLAYQKQCTASRQSHAIDRLRQLFAQAIGYPLPDTKPNFGIELDRFVKPSFELPPSFLVFVHNASWETKLWPEVHWADLIRRATESGHTILLPWGNANEEARAKRLAVYPNVHVLPRLRLSEVGYVLQRAGGCVCMDTGLSHLTAALGTPSITLYGSTDSGLIGASGAGQLHLQSTLPCAPCQKKTCRLPSTSLNPPCLGQITPETVFRKLQQIIR